MKVFAVVYDDRTIGGLESEIVSIHKTREGAIKAMAEKKAENLDDWEITDTDYMKDGYEIHENQKSYFLILDIYDVSRTEVCIEEHELLEDE